MADPHQDLSAAPAQPLLASDAAAWLSADDHALGFECADPALQIDAWREQWSPGEEPN